MSLSIALFGTSADPPSVGHQQILAWLGAHYDKCIVWVSDNPFKQHQANLAHRLAMMRLTIEDLPVSVQNVELHPHIAHSRTIFTLELAQKIWTDAQFTLVVGADLVPQLPRWYRAGDLLSQVKLLIMPRVGRDILPEDIATLEAMGTQVSIAPVHIADVSSTAYRNHHDQRLVSSSVYRYIKEHGLYQRECGVKVSAQL
jgi:nicotinate-nucleotide adenylyltransferase